MTLQADLVLVRRPGELRERGVKIGAHGLEVRHGAEVYGDASDSFERVGNLVAGRGGRVGSH